MTMNEGNPEPFRAKIPDTGAPIPKSFDRKFNGLSEDQVRSLTEVIVKHVEEEHNRIMTAFARKFGEVVADIDRRLLKIEADLAAVEIRLNVPVVKAE